MYVESLKKEDKRLILTAQEIPGTRKDGQTGMCNQRIWWMLIN